jgi:hypothetical protein
MTREERARKSADGIGRLEQYLRCQAALATAGDRRRAPAGPARPTVGQADAFALSYAEGRIHHRCRRVAGLLGLAALLLFSGALFGCWFIVHGGG